MGCKKGSPAMKAAIAKSLPGAAGFVLIEYRGNEKPQLESRTTEAIYTFVPGTMRYVDAFDVGMLDEHLENGEQVFFEIKPDEEATNASAN